jgi:nucleoside-diphosphate-sugar epimerase
MNECSFFYCEVNMYRVLITGAFGLVGNCAVKACLESGDEVLALEMDGPRTRKAAAARSREWKRLTRSSGNPEIVYGDVREAALARRLAARVDAVIHLAALIPPRADAAPELARSVNVGGTRALAEACAALPSPPRFVLASSIAAYGDRVDDYWIRKDDPLDPSPGDEYARTKVEAESIVRSLGREAGLPFAILRLTAIMAREKLDPDPLLFHMPLRTKLEICTAEDTGRAFARAAREAGIEGQTFDIGGGESCRCEYGGFLDRMFRLIGLGGIARFPAAAFAQGGFHCGWYADSDEAERALRFRSKGLEDFYADVAERTRAIRPLAALAAPFIRARMLAASPFLRTARA